MTTLGRRFMLDYDPRAERATRDVVSRAMFEQMRNGVTGPNGGVFISMAHLDSDSVRRQFKGMVKRCADIGLDLVSSPVEVTPSAHYIMGGIQINTDCSTSLTGVFAAGEDTGGVHGSNRLGGNGVGNSTVFGGIAGDTVAAWVIANGEFAEPDRTLIQATLEQAVAPFDHPSGDLNEVREALYQIMWEHAGILRSNNSLDRAETELFDLSRKLEKTGLESHSHEFNVNWHDHLNLRNQILVSQAIVTAAKSRNDSRGAHYLIDNPHTGPLEESYYTRITLGETKITAETVAVKYTRLQP